MMISTATRIAITGGSGFLGWHTACRLRAVHGIEPTVLSRSDLLDETILRQAVDGSDVVLHIAGVNRAETDAAVEQGNAEIADRVATALECLDRPIDVVFANSVQADLDNAYGRGKAAAATTLAAATSRSGGRFADIRLPNLFGEHGRPHYNSFVATLVHEVAAGRVPDIAQDREIPLLHAQRAADALIKAIGASGTRSVRADHHLLSDVLESLRGYHDLYRQRGEIPALTDDFGVDLFNTYRAATFPEMWPIHPQVHTDGRGDLFESVRVHGGTGQSFISTTKPGQTRGNHYHLHKVERFAVVQGEAEIRLRRLLSGDTVSFRVTGASPSFVDMPTLWVHNIKNVGEQELITMFWADQLLDPDHPDQYPEQVDAQ